MNEKNTLYIVVPCYKEQEVLPETSRRLREKMRQLMDEGKISRRSRVMFVNDGSSDNTWAIISELHEKEPEMFSGVNLSRNRGHQNALLAGLLTAVNDADMIVSMDADLQDDINAVDEMVDDYHKGYDVVYGVRSKRETDTFFKRFTAEGFYKVMKALGVLLIGWGGSFTLLLVALWLLAKEKEGKKGRNRSCQGLQKRVKWFLHSK